MPRTKQFKEEEVLDKAMNLFWEKGFHATSMQDLVATLGINRASMYDTFGNKETLFDKAISKYKAQNAKRVADFLYYQTNVRQGLYLLFENSIDQVLQNGESKGCFVVNSSTELANSDEKIKQLCSENKLAFEQIYINYLQYGINQGQISPYKDIKAIAAYLYTLQSGIQVISKIQTDKEALLKLVSTGLSILD